MKIGLIGGTQGVGYEFLLQALEQGHSITALARSPEKLDSVDKTRLTIVKGSVEDPELVFQVVKEQDVIVNNLGTTSRQDTTICSRGTRVILEQMKKAHVTRILTVTSAGVGDSAKQLSCFSWLILNLFLKKLIDDKQVQEQLITSSGLIYTLIRPPMLTNGPKKAFYKEGVDFQPTQMSRKDVAHCLLKHLNDTESSAFMCSY